MRNLVHAKRLYSASIALLLAIVLIVPAAFAQEPPPDQAPPPSFAPEQLDRMISRIALYPDPLLAQVLTASTFPDQIPDAARWADEHHYLTGEELAKAITDDQLPWDPSVQALLPFSERTWRNGLGHELDQRPGQRRSGAAPGCHGRRPAHAPKGA
jgi:Protein of unknown function (DUF3300)